MNGGGREDVRVKEERRKRHMEWREGGREGMREGKQRTRVKDKLRPSEGGV